MAWNKRKIEKMALDLFKRYKRVSFTTVAAPAAKKWGGHVKDGGLGAEPPENFSGPRPLKTGKRPFQRWGTPF